MRSICRWCSGKRSDEATYVRDVALADGSHQALLSSTPINYQADDGSWQPIDPRFEAVAGGFRNSKNNLQISAGQNQAVLRLLRSGQAAIGWEPLALLLDGQELAHLLTTDEAAPAVLQQDGQTIHYPASWSLLSLQEEVAAGPGRVEQSLVLVEPPHGTGEVLALRANLHLLPGGQLYADGMVQTGAFVTQGPLEVRDAQGRTVLVLLPPRALERDHPAVQVAGSYRLAPAGEGTWQVAVETPWSSGGATRRGPTRLCSTP